jgi:cytochrome oxidase Cu insertion factor (SCO1/SenC/PrrC family)
MTFTFVNCPDPNACPVLLNNFSRLQEDIKASGIRTNDILLVSVSIDLENDKPETMKEHA